LDVAERVVEFALFFRHHARFARLRDKKESVSLVWAIREAECGDWEILTSAF
jgi:hypothetical protein